MERTTIKHVNSVLATLRDLMPDKDFSIEGAYGMHRLVSKNQSHTESGYMSIPRLYEWMQAYKAGYYAAKESAK